MNPNGYWAPLADVLPDGVITAMDKAVDDANHRSTGREGEPVLLAGVRGLLKHVVLKADHDAEITQWVVRQRSEMEDHEQKLVEVCDRVRAEVKADLERLESVRELVWTTRKTVTVADLRVALGIDHPASTTGGAG